MPELVSEGVPGPRDHLAALVALVQARLNVARFAEQLLLEDDIVDPEPDLTDGTLETVLMPGQRLSALTVHLDPS